MISFDKIPAALRYPGAYIEVDGSKAGLGEDIPAVLLIGQKLATGTAPSGEITLMSSEADAVTKCGAGSMLAQMAKKYRALDKVLDVYLLPLSDNGAGVQATGTITATAVPTEAGTLALYINGEVISVGVTANMAVGAVATAIGAAVNAAGVDCPVTATVNAAVVTLTARHKGTCGNDIDVRLGLYGEAKPAGLGLTITGLSGGSGNPDLTGLPTIMGSNRWYRYVASGINDAAALAVIHNESQRRYAPPVQAGFRAFTAHRGDYAAAVAFGDTKNYEHISMLSLGINPTSSWEAAAILAAAAAPKLYNSPVESLEGVKLTGMVATSYHDWTQANSLLFKGMSIMEIGVDGSCYIKRLISMYQERSDGSADDAYLDINAAEVMERIRYVQRMEFIKQCRGTAAAKTNEGYRPGLRITTEDTVRALLLSTYKNKLMQDYGWVQNYEFYKSNLVVEQNSQNPSRFDYVDTPVLLSPFYIVAGRAQFRKTAE